MELTQLWQFLLRLFGGGRIIQVLFRKLRRVIEEFVSKKGSLFNLLPFSPIVALDRVFSSSDRFLDFGVYVLNHAGKMVDKVLFVLSSIVFSFWILLKQVFKEIIVTLLAWSCIVSCIWEQIIRTEADEIEFANVVVIEMISHLETDMQWIISILPHKLVKLFTNIVHFVAYL